LAHGEQRQRQERGERARRAEGAQQVGGGEERGEDDGDEEQRCHVTRRSQARGHLLTLTLTSTSTSEPTLARKACTPLGHDCASNPAPRADSPLVGAASELILGIDLGTTYSSAAALVDGRLHFALDGRGESCIPSVVHFPRSGPPVVGADAEKQ